MVYLESGLELQLSLSSGKIDIVIQTLFVLEHKNTFFSFSFRFIFELNVEEQYSQYSKIKHLDHCNEYVD